MGVGDLVERLMLRARALASGRRLEDDIDREMQFHVDMEAARLIELGVPPAEAGRQAHVAFGGRQRFREEARDELRSHPFADLVQDLRHAARVFGRTPAFTITVLLTLAIGIGATTVIFSVTDGVVFRALPYPDADRIASVQVEDDALKNVTPVVPPTAAQFLAWKHGCTLCERVAAIRPADFTLTLGDVPTVVHAVRVSGDLFPILGARPERGRLLTDDDDRPGGRVVVVSDAFWRTVLGGREDVVGRTITLNDAPWTVIGVAAADFHMLSGTAFGSLVRLPSRTDLFVPLALAPYQRTTQGEHDYGIIMLPKPGAGMAALHAQLDAVDAARSGLRPSGRSHLIVSPLRSQIVGRAARPLALLLAAVSAVLLIMCLNLSSLFLARSVARRRESAVRVALGAGRARVVRQAITETVALAVAGGLLGTALAFGGVRALVALAPADLPRLDEVGVDARVLIVSLAASLLAGVIFGVAPAVRLGRLHPGDVLRESARGAGDARDATRARRWLIASQSGLSAVLLIVAALFLRSFVKVIRTDRGFSADRLLAVTVGLPTASFPSASERIQFADEAMRRMAALPGVVSVAVANAFPLEGEAWVESIYKLAADGTRPVEREANFRFVSPDYFDVMGIRITAGRTFAPADRGTNRLLVSDNAARALWPGLPAVGRRVRLGGTDSVYEVIGTTATVRTTDVEHEGSLTVYRPYWERGAASTIILRTAGDPRATATAAAAVVHAVSPSVTVVKVRTAGEVLSGVVAQRRFETVLITAFACIALLTASVGIYGIIAHSMSRRMNEMSVRIALGAQPADVRWLVVRETMLPVLAGLAAGVCGAMLLGRYMAGLLYQVESTDPVSLTLVPLVLIVVATVACWVPARRASRINPVDAMRAA